MKTTVKTRNGRVVVQPLTISGELQMHIADHTGALSALCLTLEEAGALIFGMEQALEVIDQRHRAALQTMRAAA